MAFAARHTLVEERELYVLYRSLKADEIKTLEDDIEERNSLNALAKKAIADTKKKIKALEKLEAKERAILGDLYEEPIYKPYTDINRVCGEECDCNTCDFPVID